MDFDASAPPCTCVLNCIRRSSENSPLAPCCRHVSAAALWFHNHILVCACMHFQAHTHKANLKTSTQRLLTTWFLITSKSVLVSTSSNVCLPYEFLIPTLLHPLLRVQHVIMIPSMLTCRSCALAFFCFFLAWSVWNVLFNDDVPEI
jgi:hypothetical protein